MPDPTLLSKSRVAFDKPPVSPARGMGILTTVAFLFFIAVALVYGGIFFYTRTLEDNLNGLTRQLAGLEEEIDPERIQEIAQVDRGLITARSLLSAHVHPANIFELIESHTLKKVRYMNFIYGLDGKRITLAGQTDGYVTLNDQINHLRTVPELEDIKFTSISISETGSIGFSLDLVFEDNLLKFKR